LADANGDWTVDFVNEFKPGEGVWAHIYSEDGVGTAADYWVPNPHIDVLLGEKFIQGTDWTPGATVTLTIDDGGAGYSEPQVANEKGYVRYELWGVYTIQPSQIVTLDDGTFTRTHTIIDLQILNVDPEEDIVYGSTDTDITVYASVHDFECTIEADRFDGLWSADFKLCDPSIDILPGISGWVEQRADGGETDNQWRVPYPIFSVFVNTDWIEGEQWPLGVDVTLTIDDPGTPDPIDYSDTQEPHIAPWNPLDTQVEFHLDGFDVQTGHIVTMTDGETTRNHVVLEVDVTSINPVSDEVIGTSDPDTDVLVSIYGDCCYDIFIPADGSGSWVADFSLLPDPYDLVPGIEGGVELKDSVGNNTRYNWRVPNPRFQARPDDNAIEAWDWPVGAAINLYLNGDLIDHGQTPEVPEWDPNTTYVWIQLEDLDLIAGDEVILEGGGYTKEHNVTTLQVDNVDAESNTVSGTAAQGSWVEVWIHGWDGSEVQVQADAGDGSWTAPLPDFGPGTNGAAVQWDDDNDQTWIEWSAPYPPDLLAYADDESFLVRDNITSYFWPSGRQVTLEIDNPYGPDYSTTIFSTEKSWLWVPTLDFSLEGIIDLQPGQVLTLSDGELTIIHTIRSLNITSIDKAARTISGTADIGEVVTVEIYCNLVGRDLCAFREETADSSGLWTADFSVPGDQEGEEPHEFAAPLNGEAIIFDGTGGSTNISFALLAEPPEGFTPTPQAVIPTGGDIHIAVAAPLSGGLAHYGEESVNAVQMAVEDYGPIHGHNLRLTTFDSQCSPYGGVIAATDIITDPTILGVEGHLCSFSTAAGLPLYEVAGVVTISGISTHPYLPPYGPNVFNRTAVHETDGFAQWMAAINEYPSVQDWRADYQARFPGASMIENGAIHYDAAMLLLTRIEEVASIQGDNLIIDRAELATAVRQTEDYIGVTGCIFFDSDGNRILDLDADCVADSLDNAPVTYNPDQSDIDFDGVGDVEDACPADPIDECDPSGSASESFDDTGGSLVTPDEDVQIDIPPTALQTATSISITDTGSGYILDTDIGGATAVIGVEIGPPDTEFNSPITIIMKWDDGNDDGIVDGTTLLESDLFISKDGEAITELCIFHEGCDEANNIFVFEVTSLSKFVLGSHDIVYFLSIPQEPIVLDTEIAFEARFISFSANDSYSATWIWGDGWTYPGEIGQAEDSYSVTGFYTYDQTGVYRLKLIVEENGSQRENTFEYIVVYDPDGGFVTGGGWIDSPEGAYTPDQLLSGKATFGFVSKYKKGATTPVGETEFRFQVADLNFHSDSYQWLVVAGPQAQFKGIGTINGTGNFGFMISCVDAMLTPSTEVDLFRIKIWDIDNDDMIVYDNQLGDADDADPTTGIGGGSIVIHKAK
jgi:hypothetical protein